MRKNRTVPIFLLVAIIFLAPGAWAMAKRPPLTQRETEKPRPEDKNTSSLTLHGCFELALKRSETVAIRKEEIENAKAQIFKAASEAIGDVDFVITDFRQEAPEGGGGGSSVGSTLSARDRRERKFVIKQPLFQGFKSIGALTGAGGLKKQRQQEWIRAKELLFLDVASAFYGLVRSQKDVETIESIHRLFEERITELTEREKIGRSRPSEVATARAKMKILEAELAGARGALAIRRYLLEFLTGIPVGAEQLRDEEPDANVTPDLSNSLEAAATRADVEAAQQAMKTAKRGILVAQSSLWPEISLEHNHYEKREGFQSGFDWDLLFKVDVPLSRGGENIGKVKEAVSYWKKAKLNYSLAERQAELEIKQSYEEWMTSVNQSNAIEEAVKASHENYRLQKEEYEHNLVNNLDVLTALESLHQTQREANRIYYQMKENYWRLQVALGEAL